MRKFLSQALWLAASSSLIIATIWHDLCATSIRDAQILEKEKSENGFLHFMIAHYFFWTYPKNVVVLVVRWCCSLGCNFCEHYLQGSELWLVLAKEDCSIEGE
jgi:hypothetical protein